MTETMPVLRARNTAPIAAPAPAPARALSERLQEAEAFSKAGKDMLPAAYVGNVGACLLAVDFAEKNGLDFLTVVQNVSFIRGKPMLSSELWEARAVEMGYHLSVDTLTATDCTVSIFDSGTGEKVGSWSSNYGDDHVPNNDSWKKYPRQMLHHNAVRNVCKMFAKGRGGRVMFSLDEDPRFIEAAEVDPVEVLNATADVPLTLLGEPDPHAGFPPATGVTENELKAEIAAAGLKPADILRQHPGKTLADIAADPALLADVTARLETE